MKFPVGDSSHVTNGTVLKSITIYSTGYQVEPVIEGNNGYVLARNVNGVDRTGQGRGGEREWERLRGRYNEGIDMLIRDRGVAACVFRWCSIPLRARTHARTYSHSYTRAHG